MFFNEECNCGTLRFGKPIKPYNSCKPMQFLAKFLFEQ